MDRALVPAENGRAAMEEAAISDQTLMRRLARGETSALESLYDRYSARAFGLALRICRERSLAEDAVQTAFAKLLEKRRLFDEERGSFESWFLSIVRNCCIDLLRREGREPTVSIDELAGIDGGFETSADGLVIRRALMRLPPANREVILLAYFGGYTHRQLAEKLGLPLGTVKSRIRIGLERLSTILSDGGGLDDL